MSDTTTPTQGRPLTEEEKAAAHARISSALAERELFLGLLKAALPYVEMVERQLQRAALLPLGAPGTNVPEMLARTQHLLRAIHQAIPGDPPHGTFIVDL